MIKVTKSSVHVDRNACRVPIVRYHVLIGPPVQGSCLLPGMVRHSFPCKGNSDNCLRVSSLALLRSREHCEVVGKCGM